MAYEFRIIACDTLDMAEQIHELARAFPLPSAAHVGPAVEDDAEESTEQGSASSVAAPPPLPGVAPTAPPILSVVPTPDTATPDTATPDAVELDSRGFPYRKEIHSRNKTRTDKGTGEWTKKRKRDEAEATKLEAEWTASQAGVAPATPAAPAAVVVDPLNPSVDVPAAPPALPGAAPAAPVAPPQPDAVAQTIELATKCLAVTDDPPQKSAIAVRVRAAMQSQGLAGTHELTANPQCAPAVYAELQKLATELNIV